MPETKTKRPRGRPRHHAEVMDVILTFRTTRSMADKITAEADKRGISRNDAFAEAMAEWISTGN